MNGTDLSYWDLVRNHKVQPNIFYNISLFLLSFHHNFCKQNFPFCGSVTNCQIILPMSKIIRDWKTKLNSDRKKCASFIICWSDWLACQSQSLFLFLIQSTLVELYSNPQFVPLDFYWKTGFFSQSFWDCLNQHAQKENLPNP